MTKYKRITGKVFGGNATATGDDPQIAQFGSALANTFIGTTDPEVIQQLPAWGQGWIGAVTPNSQFPALPEMTGVMKVLSHQICAILQEGIPSWDNDTTFYKNNFTSKNGKLYISQTDENQGNDPETDTTNWINLMQLAAHAAMPSDRYIVLTLSTPGSQYIAPADGYFYASASVASSAIVWLNLTNVTTRMRNASFNNIGYLVGIFLPVKKGDAVEYDYRFDNAPQIHGLSFVYAQGAQ